MSEPHETPSFLDGEKVIRQLLVEIQKQRMIETIDLASDRNLEHLSWMLTGVSHRQVQIVQSFLDKIVIPELFRILEDEANKETQKETNDAENHANPAESKDDPRDGRIPEQ